ncbi:MAG: radical SAM family heme chaperone HemW [Lachnospiraceae bacterium]|nr:radical SAM family heme chaperone HemW [Lachnospiraceae bacterium]
MVKKGLGVYIHIPFCVRKCRYCDFLSFDGREEEMEAYVNALIREIEIFFSREKEWFIKSVYLGGGTPSILKPEWISRIIESLYWNSSVSLGAEISMEANPGTLTKKGLHALKSVGLNRLSMGLQSTVDKELRFLGRIHSYEDFLRSYDAAVEEGFSNINIDLMSAIPYQTISSLELSLERVLQLEPAHISAYSLIVEEGTPFYEEKQLKQLLPDEDTEREMYERTKEILAEKGYERYEISNYAQKGKECRHNLLYWDRGDYIGFGLGAASCIRDMRFSNTRDLKEYSKNPWRDFSDREEVEILSLQEQMEEAMILGLRKIKGIHAQTFLERYGMDMNEVFGDVISHYEKEGLLIKEEGWLRFTQRGFDVSNFVLCEFLNTKEG